MEWDFTLGEWASHIYHDGFGAMTQIQKFSHRSRAVHVGDREGKFGIEKALFLCGQIPIGM